LSHAYSLGLGIELIRGYNPLDVLRLKQYLQFISDRESAPANEGVLNFPIRNKPLLDLAGVRYLLQRSDRKQHPLQRDDPGGQRRWQEVYEDPHAEAYVYAYDGGGIRSFLPYTVWENRDVLPRAFLVHAARPLPEKSLLLPTLRDTDFRREVLLEDFVPGDAPRQGAPSAARVAITEYLPNRVSVAAETDAPGYLVLADVWFPGWVARIDGSPTRLYRANYTFRAVEVPAGRHEIGFAFEPRSYHLGKGITACAAGLVAGISLLVLAGRRLRRVGAT
jgi:hypothetical protein